LATQFTDDQSSSTAEEESLTGPILFVAALMGLKDLFLVFIPSNLARWIDPSVTAIIAVLVVIVALYVHKYFRRRRLSRLHIFPKHPNLFNPFNLDRLNGKKNVWPRHDEAARLARQLHESKHRHLVVVGQSGAGKSTLVKEILIPVISGEYSNGKGVLQFESYGSFALDLIKKFSGGSALLLKQAKLARDYKEIVGGTPLSVRQAFDPLFRNVPAEELADALCRYLTDAVGDKPVVFIFDQIERYLQLLASDTKRHLTSFNGYDAYFFIRIIRHLKLLPNIRTLFVIRAETFYNVFEFLVMAAASGTKNDAGAVNTFICPGINTQSTPEAIEDIRSDFSKIPDAGIYLQEFEFITGLYNRELSNTFMIQLVGFVIEHFYDNDVRVKDMLKHSKDRAVAIRLLFDLLFEEFSRSHKRVESLELLKAIVFSVAIENRVSGQAISLERIAALTHIPPPTVAEGVAFFLDRGILKRDTRSEGPCFRIVHDVIGDYVVESEQFAIEPSLRDGIRSLSEARVPTEEMTKIERYSGLVSDLAEKWNIGLFVIWFFIAFGALKLTVPPFCELSYELLKHVSPHVLPCSIVNKSYATTYLMHVLWLSFIYNIDRNYFAHVFRSRTMRFASMQMGIVGAVLAIMFSQSPALLLLPVVAGGLMMGSLLVYGSCNGIFINREAEINWNWGKLTLLNMSFTAALTLPTLLVLWTEDIAKQFWNEAGSSLSRYMYGVLEMRSEAIAVIWVISMSGLMVYFWYHIRSAQQSRIAFASRLALHDRSKTGVALT
jgi:energy-coupling factor transporter ATP-binding protein EcfA2